MYPQQLKLLYKQTSISALGLQRRMNDEGSFTYTKRLQPCDLNESQDLKVTNILMSIAVDTKAPL